jgi:hypothetical protein
MNRLHLIFATLFLPLMLFGQGLYWETKLTTIGGEQTMRSFFAPKKMKVTSTQGQHMVILLDQKKVVQINDHESTYSELSFDEMEGMMKGQMSEMQQHVDQLREALKSMPEEQRKQMEGMMKAMGVGRSEDPVIVSPTGRRKEIAGYTCEEFTLKQKESIVATVWTTKQIKEFNDMRNEFQEFSKQMSSWNMLGKPLVDAMQKVEGFPMETTMEGGMKSVVTKIERRSIPPSEFEVPKGYKKTQFSLPQQEQQ